MTSTEEYRGNNPLTESELNILAEALEIHEGQYEDDDCARAEMFDYDDEYVDVKVDFADGNYENMAVERQKLSDGTSAKEIASLIQ